MRAGPGDTQRVRVCISQKRLVGVGRGRGRRRGGREVERQKRETELSGDGLQQLGGPQAHSAPEPERTRRRKEAAKVKDTLVIQAR